MSQQNSIFSLSDEANIVFPPFEESDEMSHSLSQDSLQTSRELPYIAKKDTEVQKQVDEDNLKALRSLSQSNLKSSFLESVSSTDENECKSHIQKKKLHNCASVRSIPQLPIQGKSNKTKVLKHSPRRKSARKQALRICSLAYRSTASSASKMKLKKKHVPLLQKKKIHSNSKTSPPRFSYTKMSHHKGEFCFGSTSLRMSFQKIVESPPSTLYTPRKPDDHISHSKKDISFGSDSLRMTFQNVSESPPSTLYTPRIHEDHISHSKKDISFGSNSLRMSFQRPSHGPSSTLYTPRKAEDHVSFNMKEISFGSESLRMGFHKDALTCAPDPTYYTPHEEFWQTAFVNPLKFSSARCSHIPKSQSTDNTHSYIEQRFGSDFTAHSFKISGGCCYTSERFQGIELTPGPGHYEILNLDLSMVEKKYRDLLNVNFMEISNTSLPFEISFLQI